MVQASLFRDMANLRLTMLASIVRRAEDEYPAVAAQPCARHRDIWRAFMTLFGQWDVIAGNLAGAFMKSSGRTP